MLQRLWSPISFYNFSFKEFYYLLLVLCVRTLGTLVEIALHKYALSIYLTNLSLLNELYKM